MTTDISKLTNPTYAKRLKELGVPVIKEWHFVVPSYKDSRIIQHAELKRQEVLAMKALKPGNYSISRLDSFVIAIKTAEDFTVEITKIIRTTLADVKLNLAIYHTSTPDWTTCDSEKVKNVQRKIKAVMGEVEEGDEEDYNFAVNTYIEAYSKGLAVLSLLRVSSPEIYEDIYMLEQSYKKQVSLKQK